MANPCDAKKFYDTEFEATVAAAKTSSRFNTEMISYKHGRHWHIANKNKELRSRVRTFNRTYCKPCDVYMRPGRWEKHIKFLRHQKMALKAEDP